MRKLVVGTFLSLDGVMQAPGAPNEDRDGGFQHGGWLVPYFDEKFGNIMTEWTIRAGAFLLGRKTYQIFAGSWPNATDPADQSATALNTRPKFVASRTLTKVECARGDELGTGVEGRSTLVSRVGGIGPGARKDLIRLAAEEEGAGADGPLGHDVAELLVEVRD